MNLLFLSISFESCERSLIVSIYFLYLTSFAIIPKTWILFLLFFTFFVRVFTFDRNWIVLRIFITLPFCDRQYLRVAFKLEPKNCVCVSVCVWNMDMFMRFHYIVVFVVFDKIKRNLMSCANYFLIWFLPLFVDIGVGVWECEFKTIPSHQRRRLSTYYFACFQFLFIEIIWYAWRFVYSFFFYMQQNYFTLNALV